MSTVLAIRSSLSGASSISSQLVEQTIDQLRAQEPQLQTIWRDLGENPIPHLDAAALTGIRGKASDAAEISARDLSNELIAELQAADVIVIGAPMYNFGIPSTLKAWFDYVLQPGITFQYSEAGPKGLLNGKRAIVILSRGGLFSEGPAKAMDAQEPHLRTLLAFMGVTDVTFVRAERLAKGADVQQAALAVAGAQIAQAVDTLMAAA
jgi:FMN-dependent NADH-azoreductase